MNKQNAILYLHGFGSADKPNRLSALAELLPDYDFYSPSYNPHDTTGTQVTIGYQIDTLMREYKNVVLVGTSLGGFWADYFGRKHNLHAVLLNPAVNPGELLKPTVGTNTNYVTNKEFDVTNDHLADLHTANTDRGNNNGGKRSVMVNLDDVIALPQHAEAEYSANSKYQTFPKGGHMWSNWEAVADAVRAG